MPVVFDPEKVLSVCGVLEDGSRALTERFRALFTLRNVGGHRAIDSIARCFTDPSALLKHELAYCLGQMQDRHAIPYLIDVLGDINQEPMVRHEAGEALGAIGSPEVLEILEKYANDPVPEVAETCQLAVNRINWLQNPEMAPELTSPNPYLSVDPAPPSAEKDVGHLKAKLLDENASLFDRYRAMFALRNRGTTEAVESLAEGLKCSSALFRHEIAYVLGQMQHPAAIRQLSINLRDQTENPMVRHECAEALGAIATDECTAILRDYVADKETVVRQSCEVALDMSEYEHSDQFEYADGLVKLKSDHSVPSTILS